MIRKIELKDPGSYLPSREEMQTVNNKYLPFILISMFILTCTTVYFLHQSNEHKARFIESVHNVEELERFLGELLVTPRIEDVPVLVAIDATYSTIEDKKELKIIYANEKMEDVVKKDRNKLIGKPFLRFIPTRYIEAHLDGLNKASDTIGKTLDHKCHILDTNGNEHPVTLNIHWFSSQGMTIYIAKFIGWNHEDARTKNTIQDQSDQKEPRVFRLKQAT